MNFEAHRRGTEEKNMHIEYWTVESKTMVIQNKGVQNFKVEVCIQL